MERRPAKRPREILLQQEDDLPVKRAKQRQWTRPVKIATSHAQSHAPRVYDDYAVDNASVADPSADPASQRSLPDAQPDGDHRGGRIDTPLVSRDRCGGATATGKDLEHDFVHQHP